ncbi:molybdate ABC transporter substrate-binding protein [Natronosporangium hydrolyticum]|uniref:Molybdate ABC transporter substrate-binding protein n=1 Tax=Natronosporangium hydrolyticum TaxID=2811111 RepID=A0A895YNV6_9ACTN|nr:molybdate ABC transporter substrate-binding protein [Natronosporangium hydrolyticum]QSB17169.1 molybdate ABC transporter substrate-binding protein [Natronosporangium hydrolyticum]
MAGCGGSPDADAEPAAAAGGDGPLTGEVVVFAAASLTESFARIGDEFEAAHPAVSVTFNFAGSAILAQQINQGAPADVFAAANPATMQTVTDAGSGDGEPVRFARNQLVIAVADGNPVGIGSLTDLADPEVKVALCGEQVPCGAAARTALDTAGVEVTPVTLERDVRGTLSKLTLGEVDAALVYRTDAASAAGVAAVDFPESERAVNDYPIVVLAGAGNPPAAAAFVDFVLSESGQAALAQAGFQTP